MAHGLGGTKDSGLAPFAEALAEAGLDVLAFDYRGFGASGGTPAPDGQHGRPGRGLPGRDVGRRRAPRASTRAGWCSGASRSRAATCFEAAAGRDDVAAVVALTPLVDGLAAGRHALASHTKASCCAPPWPASAAAPPRCGGRPGVMMPVVGRPGELAALTLDGCYEDYLAIAGPTWRNEIDAERGPRARWPPADQERRSCCLPGARPDRRLRPQRSPARRRQGRVQRSRRGAALPVRPLRRVARQAVVRARRRPPGRVPDPQAAPALVP